MNTVEKRGIVFGLTTTVLLIVYFLTMRGFDLAHNIELRALNALIMFAGIYLSLKTYKNNKKNRFEFLKGIGLGLITSLTVAISFSGFILVYLKLYPEFFNEIVKVEPQGEYINIPGMVGLIFIEAFASGLLFTYASMQWLKSKNMSDLESYEIKS